MNYSVKVCISGAPTQYFNVENVYIDFSESCIIFKKRGISQIVLIVPAKWSIVEEKI
jgi:hypothetical protein